MQNWPDILYNDLPVYNLNNAKLLLMYTGTYTAVLEIKYVTRFWFYIGLADCTGTDKWYS